jgi:hypothetical protein
VTRRRPRLPLVLTATLAAALAAAPAPAAPPERAPDLSILERAGVALPTKLGRFVRVDLTTGPLGNVDAHYGLAEPGFGSPVMDIFVGPALEDPETELGRAELAVASILQNSKRVSDLAAPAAAPGAVGRVWSGREDGSTILIATMVARRGAWRIKIRAAVGGEPLFQGLAEVERAIREFRWWTGPFI